MEEVLKKIKQEIDNASSIVLLVHMDPDGDAIGSALSLYLALKQINRPVDLVIPDYAKIFGFLPEINHIKKTTDIKEYDLAIALDSATQERIYEETPLFEQAKKKIVIDHHVSNTMYGDINYVDGNSPATCQIVFEILEKLNIEITKEIGTSIMLGILTDTGGFKYSSVNDKTFDIASYLYKKGTNISDIYIKTLQTKNKPQFMLEKLVRERLELLEDERIAFSYITEEDFKNCGAQKGDHEGLVDIGKSIEGVLVSVFLRESEGKFNVSLRSNSYVNVGEIATNLNGGGHVMAAGCIIKKPLNEAKEIILEEIKKSL